MLKIGLGNSAGYGGNGVTRSANPNRFANGFFPGVAFPKCRKCTDDRCCHGLYVGIPFLHRRTRVVQCKPQLLFCKISNALFRFSFTCQVNATCIGPRSSYADINVVRDAGRFFCFLQTCLQRLSRKSNGTNPASCSIPNADVVFVFLRNNPV